MESVLKTTVPLGPNIENSVSETFLEITDCMFLGKIYGFYRQVPIEEHLGEIASFITTIYYYYNYYYHYHYYLLLIISFILFIIYLLITLFIQLFFYLLTSVYVSRVYVLDVSRYYPQVLPFFIIFKKFVYEDLKFVYENTFESVKKYKTMRVEIFFINVIFVHLNALYI